MFKIGDVVQLKSGSPDMTMVTVNGEDCEVWWFEGAELMKAIFPCETMKVKGE